jgi:hypothetical protein
MGSPWNPLALASTSFRSASALSQATMKPPPLRGALHGFQLAQARLLGSVHGAVPERGFGETTIF